MAIKKIKIGSSTAIDIHDARNVVVGDGLNNAVSLTTEQYDALVTKDANTLYVITDASPSTYEQTSNKVTSLSSSSTDTQYPSAKCVYDLVGDIETLLAAL